MNGAMSSGMNGTNQNVNNRRPQNYQPPDQRKGICRDYHSALALCIMILKTVLTHPNR